MLLFPPPAPPRLGLPLGLRPSPAPPNLLVKSRTEEEGEEEEVDAAGGVVVVPAAAPCSPVRSCSCFCCSLTLVGEDTGPTVHRLGELERDLAAAAAAAAETGGEGGVGRGAPAAEPPMLLLPSLRKLPNLLALSFPGARFDSVGAWSRCCSWAAGGGKGTGEAETEAGAWSICPRDARQPRGALPAGSAAAVAALLLLLLLAPAKAVLVGDGALYECRCVEGAAADADATVAAVGSAAFPELGFEGAADAAVAAEGLVLGTGSPATARPCLARSSRRYCSFVIF